ncbi:adenylyl-sulfate kinase [Candidatus Daviesbacteria bacterium]|nr:adenylyl-sulfate kinase [Candidatus Daviesbacteria bacterium]
MKKGVVWWITGISGTGKTTVGFALYKKLQASGKNVVYLDGDKLRKVFGNLHSHTINDRRILAKTYSRICKMLSDQGLDVVCATISLFHDCHNWNRRFIKNYKEIYLTAPKKVLFGRDLKKIYKKYHAGKIKDVVGVDIKPEIPLNPDMVIKNDGKKLPDEIVRQVLKLK